MVEDQWEDLPHHYLLGVFLFEYLKAPLTCLNPLYNWILVSGDELLGNTVGPCLPDEQD